jgi:hypothetical protein
LPDGLGDDGLLEIDGEPIGDCRTVSGGVPSEERGVAGARGWLYDEVARGNRHHFGTGNPSSAAAERDVIGR